MDPTKQMACFAEDLDKLTHRYAREFDLPLPMLIGVLETKKLELALNIHAANQKEADESGGEESEMI